MLVALLGIYVYFLYQVQIVEGTERYNSATAITKDTRTVTAARGNILDRYGRVLVSNKECYNLVIDSTKLFANDDPNAVILELIEMVRGFGDTYTDDLPITTEPPFEYTDMTEIQRTMLEAYFVDKASDFKDAGLPESPSAVELMSYMRTRYGISNEYSAEEMRMIAGLRYSINVRYAVNTGEYVFVQDASMKLISSILENKLNGIEVKRSFTRQYHTENAAHILGYVGLMTQEEYEKYSLLDYANDAMVGKDGVENAFEEYLHGKDGEVEETRNASGTILSTVYTKEPEPGNNVYLTIDINLQEAVERVLDAGVNALIRTRENEKMEQTAKGLWTFEDGKYEITFNTLTFEGSPFPKFGVRFDTQNKFLEFDGSGNVFYIETEFKKDDIIKISGVKEEYADYWKNPTWFDLVKEDETLLHFRGRDGKYKLTLNKGMNAIMMEQLEKASSSSTQNATAMWVIGNDKIGFPSYAQNNINWNTDKAFNLVPLTDTKYELILLVGQNVNGVNFKFFGQKGWGLEWKGPGAYTAKEGGDYIKYASDGNFNANATWPSGKYMVMTVETSTSPNELWVKALDELPSYEMGE